MPVIPGIQLTKEEVLKRITEEEIFEKYLQLPVDEGVSYINPLRLDTNAGCRYYRNNQGRLKFKDFSKGYNWDCFGVVQFIYNCTFIDALRIIVRDFNLNNSVTLPEFQKEFKLKSKVNIKISVRSWNEQDLAYWKQYNIFGENLFHDTFPCKAIWINGEYYRCRTNDPCYCYYFGDELYKLYFPRRKTNRFFTNVNLEDYILQGYNSLPGEGDILVITKSYKDVKSLRSFGIYAVAPQSESQVLIDEQYKDLISRFPIMVCLGDNDPTGRKFCITHNITYNIPYFVFPFTMQKDFSDNVKEYGVKRMQEVINIIKEQEDL